MAEAPRKLSLAAWVWVLIAVLAAFELLAHPLIQAAIPSDESWEEASSFVRARFGPTDRIVAAPAWADPIVRHHLGDLTTLRTAAPADTAGIDRVWELGIREATTRQEAPSLERGFGGVRVRMWPITSPELLYDFVEELREATVELETDSGMQPCLWSHANPDPGGLERGPMMPSERFMCDPKRRWLWVGATVLTDLDLEPRRCIWQHPAGTRAVRTIFADVPLGERLVVHGGIDYQVARRRAFAPVTLTVWIDDERVGQLVHRDGDGWSRLEIDTSSRDGETAAVRFETTTSDPRARLFCYSASTQTSNRDD